MKMMMFVFCALMSFSVFAKDCGKEGSLSERIKDCGNTRSGNFVLVSVYSTKRNVFSVYLDKKTKLLWSDSLAPNELNYTNALRACETIREEMAMIDEVIWELPTKNQMKQAGMDGITTSLPNMKAIFWTATEVREDPIRAYQFNAVLGDFNVYHKENGIAHVRCIAQTY